MKILACVDIHGSLKALKKVKKKAKNVDLIVCAGDMSIFEEGLEIILMELNKLKKPVLVVHGNHETPKAVRDVCGLFDNTKFMHKKHLRIDNFLFLGYGGGGFSTKDPEFRKVAKKFRKIIKKDEKIILITHAPPYETELDLIYDEHAGNREIRKFLDKNMIAANICGHLHENAGIKQELKTKTGCTLLINPGPEGRIIEL